MSTPIASKPTVLIAGGGIGGLATALTMHQIGVPCTVLESVGALRPLGVGINLQPNAVREFYEMGIGASDLDRIGLEAREWALVGRNGKEIYAEPRGRAAGYTWPQYAVHRGELQMLLYRKVIERLGPDAVKLGQRVVAYTNDADGVTVDIEDVSGTHTREHGSILVGADGLHSVVRRQMHPSQPPIHWGGAVMWRGTSPGVPIRTGASFVGLGTHRQRVVLYPISPVAPETGLATINWIAEVTFDNAEGWTSSDWTRLVSIDDFIHHFESWTYDWLDVPAMLRRATTIYEYPMIDRDPVPTWRDGNVVVLGDAAHVMYPTGSNGASQAIMDARVLGASILEHGVTASALVRYDRVLCKEISALVLRNRGAGPFGLLKLVDERCGGNFEHIDDVVPAAERADFMAQYKAAAGFARDKLNAAGPTIEHGARI